MARDSIAAIWVHAICTLNAPSISSFGAAPSISANALFTPTSEMPPPGKRAAAWSWKSDASTKALEEVPIAFFSLLHQIFPSPSGGWTFAE
jgi:hypothetical protein